MFTIKRGRSVVLMYEFETFDCGLIKGQSFSEYECDLTFIFFEMHIKREIHSHQNDQTLLNILQPYYFFKTCNPCFNINCCTGEILLKFRFKLKL